ncbi:MAG: hypothetical protein IJE19_04825 [Clostridia bacterium]|nr:hypothetical protein [Clostridia bacterium]
MKKLLSVFLAFIMVFACVSVNVYAADADKQIITKVEITVDTNCAGQVVADGDFISVLSDGLEPVSRASARFFTDDMDMYPVETFEYEKSYKVGFFICPEEGYSYGFTEPKIPDGVWVNGERIESNAKNEIYYEIRQGYSPERGSYEDLFVYIKHFTVTGPEPVPTFSEKISQAFEAIFLPIGEFFTGIIFQPIADFIMMILNKI